MKKLTILFALLVTFALSASAQVAISTDNSSPASSAMLEVKSTDKGFLLPRMTEAQRNAIDSPATGLIIYQTDGTTGLYSYNGSAWKAVTVPANTYSVGDFAQGGIVFWVDETGEHGLVCAKEDQNGGNGISWYAGTKTYTMARGDGPYAGKLNTAIIIANQGNGNGNTYAARICNELQITEGGKTYGDWYLPSKQELSLMYQNRSAINATATANGGSVFVTTMDYYWSSTEYDNNTAWVRTFNNGNQAHAYKSQSTYKVRAVRAF